MQISVLPPSFCVSAQAPGPLRRHWRHAAPPPRQGPSSPLSPCRRQSLWPAVRATARAAAVQPAGSVPVWLRPDPWPWGLDPLPLWPDLWSALLGGAAAAMTQRGGRIRSGGVTTTAPLAPLRPPPPRPWCRPRWMWTDPRARQLDPFAGGWIWWWRPSSPPCSTSGDWTPRGSPEVACSRGCLGHLFAEFGGAPAGSGGVVVVGPRLHLDGLRSGVVGGSGPGHRERRRSFCVRCWKREVLGALAFLCA